MTNAHETMRTTLNLCEDNFELNYHQAILDEYDDLRSIFKRVVDIIGFHNGDDSEKVEAIRQVMLTAKHLEEPCA